MAKRTVHIPDDLDDRVHQYGGLNDNYSKLVQQALREFLDRHANEDDSPKKADAD